MRSVRIRKSEDVTKFVTDCLHCQTGHLETRKSALARRPKTRDCAMGLRRDNDSVMGLPSAASSGTRPPLPAAHTASLEVLPASSRHEMLRLNVYSASPLNMRPRVRVRVAPART